MSDPLKNKSINSDVAAVFAADQVMKQYAKTLDRLTQKECEQFEIESSACKVLVGALGPAKKGIIDEHKKNHLLEAGFAGDFVQQLAGSDGKIALQKRVRWLAERVVTRWWRFDDGNEARENMLQELAEIGPEAKGALPELLELLKEKGFTAWRAMETLTGIGTAAVPGLRTTLESSDRNLRKKAVEVLGEIGKRTQTIDPALIKALHDVDYLVRATAAGALGELEEKAQESVPALMEALKDENAAVRLKAAEALGRIGTNPEWVVPALTQILKKDKEDNVRRMAAQALGNFGEKAREAVRAVTIVD